MYNNKFKESVIIKEGLGNKINIKSNKKIGFWICKYVLNLVDVILRLWKNWV